jgi:hypothetical protein
MTVVNGMEIDAAPEIFFRMARLRPIGLEIFPAT